MAEIVFRGSRLGSPDYVVNSADWPVPPSPHTYLAAPLGQPDHEAEKFVLAPDLDAGRLAYDLHDPARHGDWPSDSAYVNPA